MLKNGVKEIFNSIFIKPRSLIFLIRIYGLNVCNVYLFRFFCIDIRIMLILLKDTFSNIHLPFMSRAS